MVVGRRDGPRQNPDMSVFQRAYTTKRWRRFLAPQFPVDFVGERLARSVKRPQQDMYGPQKKSCFSKEKKSF